MELFKKYINRKQMQSVGLLKQGITVYINKFRNILFLFQYVLTYIYVHLIIGRVTPVFEIHICFFPSLIFLLTHAKVSSFPVVIAFCGMKTSNYYIADITFYFIVISVVPAMFRFVCVSHSSLEVMLWMHDFRLLP